jgi:transposase
MPSYPSSLTDAEWEFVRDMVPQSKPLVGRGRPCTWSKREILDAIFYVVRGGIQWRMIPNDLPPWKTVYHYFRKWSKEGVWIRIHDALRDFARQMNLPRKSRHEVW